MVGDPVLVDPGPLRDPMARAMDAGFGRMVGRRGEALFDAVADMMLGSWIPFGLVLPYVESGGVTDRLWASTCSWIGEVIEVWRTGECPLMEDPDEREVVRLRRLLP